MEEKKIFTDHEVFEQIKDASRKSYINAWQDLKNFTNGHNFEEIQTLKICISLIIVST